MDLPDPILITGCARSGTSMTAGIFSLCGAFGGDMSGPTTHNRRGMFENQTIRNDIVKPYLSAIGMDPLGQHPLPNTTDLPESKSLRWEVLSTMIGQGYEAGPWFYKGAKMCLLWPNWHTAFKDAKWIIVRRNDGDIIHSCMRTGFMRAFRNAEGWQGWIDHHKRCFQEMQDGGLQVREVWAERFIDGEFGEIRDAIAWCGLEWDDEAALEFVSPKLWSTGHGK